MIRKLYAAALALLAALSLAASPAVAANITVKDGAGTSQTMCTVVQGDSSQAYCFTYRNAAGTQVDLATAANQATNTAAITALGSPLQAGVALPAGTNNLGTVNTVVQGTATDIGASVSATTATTLAASNASRRGFAVQNQTTGNCYVNGSATPTGSYHDLLIAAGAYYESKDSHVGTGAIQIYCAAAGGVYGRQW
jgi:hypothetical protein